MDCAGVWPLVDRRLAGPIRVLAWLEWKKLAIELEGLLRVEFCVFMRIGKVLIIVVVGGVVEVISRL